MNKLNWREALPRMVADFIIIHVSMIAALAISLVYRAGLGNQKAVNDLTTNFAHYYLVFFWLLSPIFLLVFLINGFYTHTRGYVGRYKTWAILRGVMMAILVFFGINVLFFGYSSVGRSVAVPFVFLAGIGLASARLLKAAFERHFEVKPKNKLSISKDRGRVLVIGGAGYIGSLLVERLLEKRYRVRVLDSLLYGDEALFPVKNHPDFELIVGDCRNIQDVVKATRGVGSIIDLAAIVGDPACNQDGAGALETNYAATRMLIEIAKGHGASRLVFASSCSVYGSTDIEAGEEAPAHPISLYAQTKVDSEKALLDAQSDTFNPTILRYATVFGLSYRPRFDLVVNLLTARAKQEGIITIYNGQQWRPFIHVRDLAEATVQILESAERLVGGKIFNVGDKRLNHTLSQVGDTIRHAIPNVQVEHVENLDVRNYRVDFEKLYRTTGFQARYTLLDGIMELATAFDEHVIADYKDLRYHNRDYLKAVGSSEPKNEVDAWVMEAFSNHHTSPRPKAASPQALRRPLNAEVLLQAFCTKLTAAATSDECWEILQRAYGEFGFNEIRFKIGDRLYCHNTNGHGVRNPWTVRIQLSENDYLNLSREFEAEAAPILSRFSDVIAQVLTAKTAAMMPLSYP